MIVVRAPAMAGLPTRVVCASGDAPVGPARPLSPAADHGRAGGVSQGLVAYFTSMASPADVTAAVPELPAKT